MFVGEAAARARCIRFAELNLYLIGTHSLAQRITSTKRSHFVIMTLFFPPLQVEGSGQCAGTHDIRETVCDIHAGNGVYESSTVNPLGDRL